MKRCRWLMAYSFAVCTLFSLPASAASAAPAGIPAARAAAQSRLAEIAVKLPLRFEENVGQLRTPEVRYFARGRGYRLLLEPGGAIFSLGGPGEAAALVRLRAAGGAERPALAGTDPLPTKSNYFRGNDPRAWRTGIPSFAAVRYGEVYPGTDLVFSGNERRVEESFFLQAGADPRRIRMVYEGASGAEVTAAGDLVLRTSAGVLKADRPVAWQVAGGAKRPVECRYELARNAGDPEVGFVLGEYDRGLPLVIDPVFSGGMTLSGSGYDIGHAVAVDASGNVYVAGSTTSTDFIGTIIPGGAQPANAGNWDGFVAKIDPTGTNLLYSTYFGGSDVDEVEGIAVDASGNAYLTGYTFSANFPGVTAGSLQSAGGGGRDAFVAKLGPSGSTILYSTYLGGSGSDFGNGIAVDASGNAYVAGSTSSANFPGVTASSLQPANAGGPEDAFVAKLNAAGTGIVYSTYFGTGGDDLAYQIALDSSGGAVIAGATCSPSFPVTTGALATAAPGGDCANSIYDAFAARLNPAGTALVYSTYLGGAGNDVARGVAVDASANAYVAGYTNSSAFTGVTASAFQPANPGGYAAFLVKLNAAGSAAGYATFLGGGSTFGWGVAVDSAASAYVTGGTGGGFPVVNADTLTPSGSSTGFITRFDAAGAVLYSSYSSGTSATDYAVAVDGPRKTVHLTGSRGPSGTGDAFLTRIAPSAVLAITKTADVTIVDPNGTIAYTLSYRNIGELDATGATLAETVPDNTKFKPLLSTPGWSCTPSTEAGSSCTLALGTVAAGSGGSVNFTVNLKQKLSATGSQISNTACAQPGPYCAFVQTPTTAAPVLSITKTANFSGTTPGSFLKWTIKVFNTGNMDTPVLVTDTVPANTVFDPTNSSAGWSCSPSNAAGSTCTYRIANVVAGGNRAAVTFSAILQTAVPQVSNTACAEVATSSPELAPRHRRGPGKTAAPVCATVTTSLP